jgi:GNAT superfamily N-acetyltransferase
MRRPHTAMDPLAASHANLAHAMRVMARWQGPFACEERAGAMLVRGTTRFPSPYLNAALPMGPIDPAALRAEAAAFFSDRRHMVWTRGATDLALADHLTSAGWMALGELPIMVVEGDVPPVQSPFSVRAVQSPSDLARLVDVSQAAYEEMKMPPPVTAKLFRALTGAPEDLDEGADLGLAYDGDHAVAAVVAITHEQIGGLYWVGTRPSARGRGAARAVTVWATRRCFARGARLVTLQASEAGEPVYRRLGYREVARYGRYLSPPPAEG